MCSTNPYILKLSTLFAKYLYQHKKLSLPGIGTFSIDPAVTVPDISDKLFTDFLQQIKFEQKNDIAAEDNFIDFIRTETGKIRPLAESDLDSFLTDGKILLNIGKPFQIEGIGSLQKNKEGTYMFTPGTLPPTRIESARMETITEKPRKSVFAEDNYQTGGIRKLVIAASIIVGIVLVIWLGYRLYNRSANIPVAEIPASSTPVDTARANIILDSAQKIIDSTIRQTSRPTGTYKFIIEKTLSKARAFKRYNQLIDNRDDIKMEVFADSTLFHLYLILPATPADTARIRDSLKNWYGRKQVFIE